MRVPKKLRPLYGKKEFIRKALNTSDYHKAVSEVRFEVGRVEAEFAEKRRELENARRANTPPPVLSELSDGEAHAYVLRFFIGLEKETAEWCADIRDYSEEKREHLLENLRVEECVYAGTSKHYEPRDGREDLTNFLKREGIDCPPNSPAFRKLRQLFYRARMENLGRAIDRVEGKTVQVREPYFRDVFAHTVAPTQRQFVTLGAMLAKFFKDTAGSRGEGTKRTYEVPARILREFIGENTALEAVTKESIEHLFVLLRRVPANATQRYRGLTLRDAIEAADKRDDTQRLAGKTLANYYRNILAIFNFAVEKRLIAENPAKDKYLHRDFERNTDTKAKAQFTTEELNRLFRAPLYTGCLDDEHGYATPGENKPRRGRFWLPLIALFHGFRCNEVAQLYTEDVGEGEGIWFFEIREERADGTKCDKRLKTKQSKRRVPIHPEIISMGFRDFVSERRRDETHPRLFPDLPIGATGYFSNPFSKWFARFVNATLGENCAASFHSFRHQFRDALWDAGVATSDVEKLGGWELAARSSERHYGRGPSLSRLKELIDKVKYPGLDLSHLHSVQAESTPTRAIRARKRSRPPAT